MSNILTYYSKLLHCAALPAELCREKLANSGKELSIFGSWNFGRSWKNLEEAAKKLENFGRRESWKNLEY